MSKHYFPREPVSAGDGYPEPRSRCWDCVRPVVLLVVLSAVCVFCFARACDGLVEHPALGQKMQEEPRP